MQTFEEFINLPSWVITIDIKDHGKMPVKQFNGTREMAEAYAKRLCKAYAHDYEISWKLIDYNIQPLSYEV
jgi:hypothetical protein